MRNQALSPPEDSNARGVPPTDGFLVDQFVTAKNPDAFATLMERHGPYVLALCRRLTYHAQDAEDVFQACFLELVRDARTISRQGSVAGWLHTVARRIARRLRLQSQRQQQTAAQAVKPAGIDTEDITWREVRQVLEEEVAQLPEELRTPVILCLFQELTQEEAAHHLQINPRTLRDRLQRGRARLRDRLTRRGVTLAVLGAVLSANGTQAAVASTLQQTTLKGAAAVASKGSLAGIVSPAVLGMIGPLPAFAVFAGWGTLAAAALGVMMCASSAYLAWGGFRTSPAVGKVEREASSPAGELPRRMPTLRRSFRKKQFDADVFAWHGTNPEKYARLEDEGLRITLPEKDGPPQPIGVKLRYRVHGDFDIEATLEVLSIDPTKSFGSGVNLYLQIDSDARDGLWLGKMKLIRQPLSFDVGRIVLSGETRALNYEKARPTFPEKGHARLRMVRQGARFSFFTAEGEAGAYQLLDSLEISAAEVKLVRFAVEPGHQNPTGVDARLVDFSMTAQELVGLWPNHTQP